MVMLHGPDRNFNVQNFFRQATHLLINALALADETPPDGFWSAIDLGWPVNTLELALYTIDRSGKPAGIFFQGVPKGYDEIFFRGSLAGTEVRNIIRSSTPSKHKRPSMTARAP